MWLIVMKKVDVSTISHAVDAKEHASEQARHHAMSETRSMLDLAGSTAQDMTNIRDHMYESGAQNAEKWSRKRFVKTYSTLRGPWSLRAYVRRATSAIVDTWCCS